MGNPICVVDAFTEQRFSGNPAAVCFPDGPREAAWMQAVAREMNLAETAFVTPRAAGFDLRWFTPTVEVDLCGHATLASAHALWESGRLAAGAPARFQTRSGDLTARAVGPWIEMDFPSIATQPGVPPPDLLAALGVGPQAVRWSGTNSLGYLVELEEEAAVRALRPNPQALRRLPVVLACVTASGRGPHDFVSRLFAPAIGIDEDPVTGGSHCFLGPYWAAKLGKHEVLGYQASARGGHVRVRPQGERVLLGGHAVTVWRGELA